VLQVESGCHLGNLICNDIAALQAESSGHFDHLILCVWQLLHGVTNSSFYGICPAKWGGSF